MQAVCGYVAVMSRPSSIHSVWNLIGRSLPLRAGLYYWPHADYIRTFDLSISISIFLFINFYK